MKCAEHPQNDSIGRCADCGKEICSLCLTALADKVYCPSCIDKLISQYTKETVDLNKATKKQTTSIILLWIGITGIIISLLMLLGGLFHNQVAFNIYCFGFPILMFSLPLASFGLLILLCRTNEKGKQIGGAFLFLMGIIGIPIVFVLFEAGAHSYEDIPQYAYPFIGMEVGGISFILLVAGIILFFKGRRQAKKQ